MKRKIIVILMLLSITTNVQAITSNDVTYDNNGTTENLTESLDTLIAGDADLKAENIKSGVNLFGVNGTYTSDANARASDILSGKTAYVNGSKITGTHTAQNHTYGVAAEIAKTFGSSTECEASVSLSHTIGVGTYIVSAGVSKTDGTNHDAYLDFFSPNCNHEVCSGLNVTRYAVTLAGNINISVHLVNVTRSIAAGEYIMRVTSKTCVYGGPFIVTYDWLKID